MDQSIAFVDVHRIIQCPEILLCLDSNGFDDKISRLKDMQRFDPGMFWYVRGGVNNLFFKNDHIDTQHWSIPDIPLDWNKDFAEVTDTRCESLIHSLNDRPWLISYSGGVDSTVIVASLLRNTTQQQRKNIRILCNLASVIENPRFFYSHIQPNFDLVDVDSNSINDLIKNHYIFTGEPGDQIYSHYASRWLYDDGLGWKKWRDHKHVIDRMITMRSSEKFADWLYNVMHENIESVDIEIESLFDWFWWLSFNYCWCASMIRNYFQWGDTLGFGDYMKSMINWYDSHDYQIWSMTHKHKGYKDIDHIGQAKIASKQYIYTVNKDPYFLKYKTKSESDSRLPGHRNPMVITSNGVGLFEDTDLIKIKSMLPAHFLPGF